ncbi:MAG: METTL5 family protein [Candidatus Aenigmatarchaeota archaeon]
MKKELEIILESLKKFENPKVELEQYETPSNIIAEIVNFLNLNNLIENKIILEPACGTAKISIALSFFNPKFIIAFDIDKEAIKIARENIKKINAKNIYLIIGNVENIKFKRKFDLIVQNPPFGFRGNYNDLKFLEFAFNNSDLIFSIHHGTKENLEFLKKFSEDKGFKIIYYKFFDFPIKYLFKFHRKPKVNIKVVCILFSKNLL